MVSGRPAAALRYDRPQVTRTKTGTMAALHGVLTDPDQPTLEFQPVVDLRRGVIAGYEALARFPGNAAVPPDQIFAAADQLGLAPELEARVLRGALAARDRLPPRCFLAVNVLPHLLTTPQVAAVWRDADLSRLVFELNEAVDLDATTGLTATAQEMRNRGAFVAMDDVGSGYAGLRQLARVRPDFVKLDRALVVNVDDDQVKIALTELVGGFASRLNGWVIAEGIERQEELAMLVGLGVPLGQGFLLGRPSPDWQRLDPAVARRIRQLSARSAQATSVVSLMEPVRISLGDAGECRRQEDCHSCQGAGQAAGEADGGATIIVSNRCRPVAISLTGSVAGEATPKLLPTTLFALPEEPVTEVARRAMTRCRASRFDPVIIVTEMGRPLGLVRMERLMLRLADMSAT
jgi:EAL domain-containing protein (putative c-di-GMP-specific phosphodiesterase class I)